MVLNLKILSPDCLIRWLISCGSSSNCMQTWLCSGWISLLSHKIMSLDYITRWPSGCEVHWAIDLPSCFAPLFCGWICSSWTFVPKHFPKLAKMGNKLWNTLQPDILFKGDRQTSVVSMTQNGINSATLEKCSSMKNMKSLPWIIFGNPRTKSMKMPCHGALPTLGTHKLVFCAGPLDAV